MRLIEKMYYLAKLENGVHRTLEENGKSNPRILEYLKACDDLSDDDKATETTSWCAAFQSWLCKLSGGNFNSPMARAWLHATGFKPVTNPNEGDLVILKRLIDGVDDGISGHVSMFVKFDNKIVWLYGGNQHNEVGLHPYQRKNIIGFRTSLD